MTPLARPNFPRLFDATLRPILERHGLRKTSVVPPTPIVDSLVSRAVEIDHPGDILPKNLALQADRNWNAQLEKFGAHIITQERDRTSTVIWQRYALTIWRASGNGRRVRAGPGRGRWQTYDAGGKAMFKDRDGNLWFGDKGEVKRFDGFTWTRFGPEDGLEVLPSNSIYEIYQSRDGAMWFGARNALTRFDGSSWQSYGEEHGLDEDINHIVEDAAGRMLVDGSRGVYFLAEGRFHLLEGWPTGIDQVDASGADPQDVRFLSDLFISSDGSLWVGTFSQGVLRYRASSWDHFTTDDNLPSNRVRVVTEDASGTIWIGTANGLARFDGDRWTPLTDGGAPAGEVNNIHHDLRGVVWVTLRGLGVRRFDGEWQAFTQNEGLEDNRVRSILEDDEGFLWFGGGFGGRVSRFDDTSVLTMTESDGLPHSHVTSLAQDRQGRIWIGTVAGLANYDGTTFSHVGSEHGLVSDQIVGLMIDGNERVWIGTRDGLTRWDGSVFETLSREEGLILPTARMALHEDGKGAVWVGAGGAILRYIGGTWTDTGEADAWAYAFTPDRDGVLYAVTGRGVIQYKENRWTEYEDDRLLAVIFRDIKGDRRDNLWLGTYGDGIWRIGTDSVEHFDVGEETGDRFINRILEDRSGVLWFGSGGAFVVGSGIARYDGKVFQTLTTDDGLAHNNIEAFLEDRNGDIWIGTEQGLTRYRKPKASPPPVQIEAILANGRRQDTESASISADVVTIEYDAASIKTRPEAMVFRYRLLGHDDDWQNTRSRRVEYADLPWGDYTFEVLAVDRDLVYSQSPASVALTILPPYSRIAWMTAAGIFLIAAAWQTTRVIQRDRRLRQSNKALSDANNELFEVNQTLHRDSAVQRIRAEIQSMDKTEDFDRVLSFMMTDLKQVGLTFSTCEIDVLDEPVEDPSMEHFVADGFRYTTFRLEPSGDVSSDSYNLAAPFPAMNQRTIERFIAGEPWRGVSEGEAIVEVPAGSYGRLRLTATDRDSFSEDEVATLREFAAAIALGYARYLDIREIQLQTERKSAFLASMSHELRTPMNAIKGFTNLVLRRGRDELSDRNQENLQKVDQASDHLLAMIDDLLDLSKIEAGRMDVNVESFDIAELVKSCCDTVSPLVKEGVELRHRIEGEIGEAHTDRARLHQMVINLLSNAIKFTDSGSVTVRAERVNGGEESGRKDLVISVSDTGKGIPPEELPTLFDEYRQVSGQSDSDVQKGTGLGLSITKKFAELLGGSISVESEIGRGSTFTVTIPTTYST